MKTLYLFFLVLFTFVSSATAQVASADLPAVKSAKMDVKQFKLDRQLRKQFKEHRFAYTSDYFKPGKANASDSSNLNDSVYVKAFRNYAYQKTAHRRTAGHYILLFAGIPVALVILFAIGVAISAALNE